MMWKVFGVTSFYFVKEILDENFDCNGRGQRNLREIDEIEVFLKEGTILVVGEFERKGRIHVQKIILLEVRL
jgi:hypothetical protein